MEQQTSTVTEEQAWTSTAAAQDAQTQGLIEQLEKEVAEMRHRRERRRWRTAIGVAFVAWMVWGFIHGLHVTFWPIWLLFGGGAAADAATQARRRETASALATTRDPRAARVLALAYQEGDGDIRRVCANGLQHILPLLKPADRPLIQDDGVRAIAGLLSSPSVELVLAALAALAQVGGREAIQPVEALRGDPRPSVTDTEYWHWQATQNAAPGSDISRVFEAADACLAALRARTEQERQRATLVRPTDGPADPDTLVRPAESAETPEAQLLRPAE